MENERFEKLLQPSLTLGLHRRGTPVKAQVTDGSAKALERVRDQRRKKEELALKNLPRYTNKHNECCYKATRGRALIKGVN